MQNTSLFWLLIQKELKCSPSFLESQQGSILELLTELPKTFQIKLLQVYSVSTPGQ